jgi:SAM-dependent methyltransferase
MSAHRYWDAVLEEWVGRREGDLWRLYCDGLNASLLGDWIEGPPPRRALKTDLFEEAVGEGLVPLLQRLGAEVTGIDVSEVALDAAAARYPALAVARADVRALPFDDAAFDLVVSTSTLDHFDSLADVARALGELRRVLTADGTLVLTLDNRANPVVALRGVLPFALLHRLGILPYRPGATCGPRRLTELLGEAGFEVERTRAVMHCPRALAVLAARSVPPARGGAFLRLLARFETLDRLPSRWLSAYYVAVRARRA